MEKPLSMGENISKEGVGLVDEITKLLEEYPLEMGCAFKESNKNKYARYECWY